MTAHIPAEKIQNYSEEILSTLNKKFITLRDLQSIIGKLNHTIQVIRPGKAFLRRLYNLTIGHKQAMAKIELTQGAKNDLSVWYDFLIQYNSKPFIINPFVVYADQINLGSDASHLGYSATFGSFWIQGSWPVSYLNYSIAFLELFPIFVMLNMFANKMTNSIIKFNCDNMSVVNIINNQTSKCTYIMQLMKKMVFLMLKYNLTFHATHISTHANVLNDKISRQNVDYKLLNKYRMKSTPESIPQELLPQNIKWLDH